MWDGRVVDSPASQPLAGNGIEEKKGREKEESGRMVVRCSKRVGNWS